MTKAKTNKPAKPTKVKNPNTIYVVTDEFIDIDFYTDRIVGFFYDKVEAEKYRTDHQEEMTKGVAMFKYYENKYFNKEDECEISIAENEAKMHEHSHFEDYNKTIVEEVKLIK